MNDSLRPVFRQKRIGEQAHDVITLDKISGGSEEKTPIKIPIPGNAQIRLFGPDDRGSGLAILEQ